MDTKTINFICKKVWFLLIQLAEENATISYNSLREKTGLDEYRLGLIIRGIALLCLKQKWPILSSVIDNPANNNFIIRYSWSNRDFSLCEVYEFNWKVISNPYQHNWIPNINIARH